MYFVAFRNVYISSLYLNFYLNNRILRPMWLFSDIFRRVEDWSVDSSFKLLQVRLILTYPVCLGEGYIGAAIPSIYNWSITLITIDDYWLWARLLIEITYLADFIYSSRYPSVDQCPFCGTFTCFSADLGRVFACCFFFCASSSLFGIQIMWMYFIFICDLRLFQICCFMAWPFASIVWGRLWGGRGLALKAACGCVPRAHFPQDFRMVFWQLHSIFIT